MDGHTPPFGPRFAGGPPFNRPPFDAPHFEGPPYDGPPFDPMKPRFERPPFDREFDRPFDRSFDRQRFDGRSQFEDSGRQPFERAGFDDYNEPPFEGPPHFNRSPYDDSKETHLDRAPRGPPRGLRSERESRRARSDRDGERSSRWAVRESPEKQPSKSDTSKEEKEHNEKDTEVKQSTESVEHQGRDEEVKISDPEPREDSIAISDKNENASQKSNVDSDNTPTPKISEEITSHIPETTSHVSVSEDHNTAQPDKIISTKSDLPITSTTDIDIFSIQDKNESSEQPSVNDSSFKNIPDIELNPNPTNNDRLYDEPIDETPPPKDTSSFKVSKNDTSNTNEKISNDIPPILTPTEEHQNNLSFNDKPQNMSTIESIGFSEPPILENSPINNTPLIESSNDNSETNVTCRDVDASHKELERNCDPEPMTVESIPSTEVVQATDQFKESEQAMEMERPEEGRGTPCRDEPLPGSENTELSEQNP